MYAAITGFNRNLSHACVLPRSRCPAVSTLEDWACAVEPLRYQVVTVRDGKRAVRATWLTKETAEAIETDLQAIFTDSRVFIEVMPDLTAGPEKESR